MEQMTPPQAPHRRSSKFGLWIATCLIIGLGIIIVRLNN